ncbi:Brix domain-containing protein [Paraphysoderma sedebokerense]|nr:Brix domain-containing protein [Paraphysoderma sedebokerense]
MGRRKKKRTHVEQDEAVVEKPPRSFVIKSGTVGNSVARLVRDIRKVMEPNTAVRLKERKSNKLKDFLSMAGPLGVSHFLIFSQTENATNLRIARTPRGPTLCFRVNNYSLTADVISSQRNPKGLAAAMFLSAPLLVLNNFNTEDKTMKLMATMFQNMLPPINVQTMQLAEARRLLLINYNSETNTLDFRHYSIDVKPIGISKAVKRVIFSDIPDLHKYSDISDYVERNAYPADSDMSDVEDPSNQITLPQNYVGRNNKKSEQRAIKLKELGPRMKLTLVKIQDGFCEGEVLFHQFVSKTAEEIKSTAARRAKKEQEKAERRRIQEENVKRKQMEKEARKQANASNGVEYESESESENENDLDDDANGGDSDDEFDHLDDSHEFHDDLDDVPESDSEAEDEQSVEVTVPHKQHPKKRVRINDKEAERGGKQNAKRGKRT